MNTQSPIQVMTTADLRMQSVDSTTLVLTVCDTVIGDDKGGLYRWDATSTAAEDTAFMNVIASSLSATGRWVRFAVRARTLPHGTLSNSFGIRTAYLRGVIDANSECTFNLTLDNTPTGEPIFTEIIENRAYSRADAASRDLAIDAYRVNTSANLKTTKHGFYRGANGISLTLGSVLNAFVAAPANVPVGVTVIGK